MEAPSIESESERSEPTPYNLFDDLRFDSDRFRADFPVTNGDVDLETFRLYLQKSGIPEAITTHYVTGKAKTKPTNFDPVKAHLVLVCNAIYFEIAQLPAHIDLFFSLRPPILYELSGGEICPLGKSVMSGKYHILRSLLQHYKHEEWGFLITPVFERYIGRTGDTELYNMIVSAGHPLSYYTLHAATSFNKVDIVTRLFNDGIHPDTCEEKRPRVCFVLPHTKNLQLLDLFVMYGMNLRCYEDYWGTPLAQCIFLRSFDFAEKLLHYGSDPNIAGPDGKNLLTVAILRDADLPLLKLLVEYGVEVDCNHETGVFVEIDRRKMNSPPYYEETLVPFLEFLKSKGYTRKQEV